MLIIIHYLPENFEYDKKSLFKTITAYMYGVYSKYHLCIWRCRPVCWRQSLYRQFFWDAKYFRNRKFYPSRQRLLMSIILERYSDTSDTRNHKFKLIYQNLYPTDQMTLLQFTKRNEGTTTRYTKYMSTHRDG